MKTEKELEFSQVCAHDCSVMAVSAHACDSVCHHNVSRALIWKSTQGLLVGIHSKD